MLRNVPSSKEVVQIILVLTAENANLFLKMIMNVFVVKNSGKILFRLFPIISISQKFFSIFFLTLEQFFLTVR